jgi:hypothetical protein
LNGEPDRRAERDADEGTLDRPGQSNWGDEEAEGQALDGSEFVEKCLQTLPTIAIEAEEHDSVSELRVSCHDSAARHNASFTQPKLGFDFGANRERHLRLDTATVAADVGRFEADRNVAAFDTKLERKMDAIPRIMPSFGCKSDSGKGLFVRLIAHGELYRQEDVSN